MIAPLAAIFLGIVLVVSNKYRRFQTNTETQSVLSFHYLRISANACQLRFTANNGEPH